MIALRVCDGAVSSEQRRIKGSSAAAAPRLTAGAATMAIAEATNARRDNDSFMFVLLFLGWLTDWRGRADRRRRAVLDGCGLTSCAPVVASRISIVQRMRPMPDKMSTPGPSAQVRGGWWIMPQAWPGARSIGGYVLRQGVLTDLLIAWPSGAF